MSSDSKPGRYSGQGGVPLEAVTVKAETQVMVGPAERGNNHHRLCSVQLPATQSFYPRHFDPTVKFVTATQTHLFWKVRYFQLQIQIESYWTDLQGNVRVFTFFEIERQKDALNK